MTSQNSDTTEAILASGESTLERARRKAQQQIDNLISGTLNIAITGETGVGKSTFINAIRGLNDGDEGAAKTGVTETTTEPTPYQHPTMPNVTFWDLPGVGSPKFKAKNYLKKMNFHKYDFFLIISSERFKENDIMLAKAIKKKKRLFYFIRSKLDNDIRAEEHKRGFNQEETLKKIRSNCLENLKELENPKIFLISSRDIAAYDFEVFVDTLKTELPQHVQHAWMQSLPVSSIAMLEQKVKMFEKEVWAVALVSGGVSAIPGLSLACDTAILLSFFTRCYHAFGLDDKSIEMLSERVGKPHLKHLKKSQLLKDLAKNSAVKVSTSGLGELVCRCIPVIGYAATAAISFTTMRDLLQEGLKSLADEARLLLREAGLQYENLLT